MCRWCYWFVIENVDIWSRRKNNSKRCYGTCLFPTIKKPVLFKHTSVVCSEYVCSQLSLTQDAIGEPTWLAMRRNILHLQMKEKHGGRNAKIKYRELHIMSRCLLTQMAKVGSVVDARIGSEGYPQKDDHRNRDLQKLLIEFWFVYSIYICRLPPRSRQASEQPHGLCGAPNGLEKQDSIMHYPQGPRPSVCQRRPCAAHGGCNQGGEF